MMTPERGWRMPGFALTGREGPKRSCESFIAWGENSRYSRVLVDSAGLFSTAGSTAVYSGVLYARKCPSIGFYT